MKTANTYFVGKTKFKRQLTIPRSRSLRGKSGCLQSMVREWTEFTRLLTGKVVALRKYDNKPLGSLKTGSFLDLPSW